MKKVAVLMSLLAFASPFLQSYTSSHPADELHGVVKLVDECVRFNNSDDENSDSAPYYGQIQNHIILTHLADDGNYHHLFMLEDVATFKPGCQANYNGNGDSNFDKDAKLDSAYVFIRPLVHEVYQSGHTYSSGTPRLIAAFPNSSSVTVTLESQYASDFTYGYTDSDGITLSNGVSVSYSANIQYEDPLTSSSLATNSDRQWEWTFDFTAGDISHTIDMVYFFEIERKSSAGIGVGVNYADFEIYEGLTTYTPGFLGIFRQEQSDTTTIEYKGVAKF